LQSQYRRHPRLVHGAGKCRPREPGDRRGLQGDGLQRRRQRDLHAANRSARLSTCSDAGTHAARDERDQRHHRAAVERAGVRPDAGGQLELVPPRERDERGAAGRGDKTLAPRDFAEASIDLAAFGITPCFTNVIFTSRSAHVLTGADVQDVGGANFPLCGSKSGVKFRDDNGNGVQDSGEPGLNGWTIKLYKDLNSNQKLDSTEVATATTATTATDNGVDGSYSFESLGTGDYVACEVQQTDWFQSRPFAGQTGLPTG